MLLAGDGFGGGAGRVRRAGSAPIAFALASTLSRNARILRTWSSSPGKVMPLAGRRPDGDTAVVVVVDSCVVVAAASLCEDADAGRDLTGVASLEDAAEWRYGDSNEGSGSRQRAARSAAAFLATLALAAATRSSARILPTLSRAVLARTAACMRAAASCRTLASSRARFEARSRLIALTRSRAALPRWMRCIRTAAACSSSVPTNVRWAGAPRASTRAAPLTSRPWRWRKSRSARIMFALSVASDARLIHRSRSSSVLARAYRFLSSIACLSAAAMEASSTGPYLPMNPSRSASW